MASLSFKNDDYNYLINNNELIMTCREALAENEGSSIGVVNKPPSDLQFLSYTNSPSSSQISGSLPVVDNSDKLSLDEFSRWLTRTEGLLESVCYCVGPQTSQQIIQTEIQSVGRSFINSLKANASKIDLSLLTAQENRWHVLWLKSIEYSMLAEEFNICPNHTPWNRERSSAPHSNSKRFKYGPFSEGKENIKGMMRNRRIQTNMIGIGAGPGLNETFNIPNGKYEIIHKDIGYSSDADMSDACEPASCPNYVNANAKSPRKRHRRRRPRIGERPWSFHSEWTGWDYYQPPLGFSGEYRSSEDLNSFEDENLVRSLTEFGENYERWFKTDDGILRASEDLASHEEESSSRSLTDSIETHSDRAWSKGLHDCGGGGGSKSKLLRGKKIKFFTSSPNITCSSITGGGTETADSLDFTTESVSTSSAKIQVACALPVAAAAATTFTIKDVRVSPNDDTDADADVINYDLNPVLAKAQQQILASASADEDNNNAMKTKVPTFFLPSPPTNTTYTHNYNSSSTQTHPQRLTSQSTPKSTTTPTTTSTKYFFIYLTITLLMAVILSILVATLSPISPHVQKSYPNRSPPN